MNRLLPAIIDTAKSSAGAKVGKKAPHALSGLMPRAIEAAAGGVVGGASGAAVHSARKNNTETAPRQSRSSLLRSTLIGAGLGAVGAVAGNQALLAGARKKDQAAMEAWQQHKKVSYEPLREVLFGSPAERSASRQRLVEARYSDALDVLRRDKASRDSVALYAEARRRVSQTQDALDGKISFGSIKYGPTEAPPLPKEELSSILSKSRGRVSRGDISALSSELDADAAEELYERAFLRGPQANLERGGARAFGGLAALRGASARHQEQASEIPRLFSEVGWRARISEKFDGIRALSGATPRYHKYRLAWGSIPGGPRSTAAQAKELAQEIDDAAVQDFLSNDRFAWVDGGAKTRSWGRLGGPPVQGSESQLLQQLKDVANIDASAFSTKDEFNKAVRSALRPLHPDFPGGDAEKFRAVNNALGALKQSEWFRKLASIDSIKEAIYKTASKNLRGR